MLLSWLIVLFSLIALVGFPQQATAACGATTRTWDSGGNNKNWNNDTNWSSDDHPSGSTYNAVIVSGSRNPRLNADITVACVDVQSGLLQTQQNRTLTITGDYFRSLTTNATSLNSTGFTMEMAGTAAQTLETKDRIRQVHINNDVSVRFTEEFEITTSLTFETGWTGTLYIDKDVLMTLDSAVTIPAGGTVVIGAGAIVEMQRDLTVDGTLRLLAGAKLKMYNGRTLTVSSGGLLKLEGADGNIATLTSRDSSDDFNITVAGQINAEYFRIERLNGAGLNVTGTIQRLENGEFHYLDNNGHAITLGSAATVPATLDNIGFFNDDGVGTVYNIDASAYNVSDVSLTNWSGSVGGEANDVDGNNRINWSSPASTNLTITDDSPGGNPGNTINQSTTEDFGTIAFALSAADTETSITSITLTMIGTASTSDIASVEVWRDAAASKNCDLNTGTDVNMTGAVSLSGSPPKVTVSVPSGDITTNSDLDRHCIYIRATTTANAQDDKRIQFALQATGDVTNSEGYSFSTSSGPPLTLGESRINGDTIRRWEGATDTDYDRGNNWSGNNAPTSATDCQIGLGTNNPIVNINPANCQNATLPANGFLNFNSTTNEFRVFGNLDVETGYTFQNATTGVIGMRGTGNQGFNMRTQFPGNVVINNTGNIVSVNSDSAIGGNVDVDAGTFRVVSPHTLTITGDLTISSGATFEVEPGATLKMGSGSTIDVQSGATLKLVGTSSLDAQVTAGVGETYTVTVNGTIEARYYSFENLGLTGLTINSGATINATNYLQDGAFSKPVTNNSKFLVLNRAIPGNSLENMTFELGGSTATGVKSVDTTGVATSGTLTFDGYTGDIAGIADDVEGANYLISWTGATNSIKITNASSGPGAVDAGLTYNMGRFSFQQDLSGSSFNDAEFSSIKLTLTGTGAATDIDAVRLYADSNCDSAGGTLLGTGTYSGVPETVTFAIAAGQFVVAADNTTPPANCLYVEYDIAASASDSKTVGVEIASSGDITNDQSYLLAGSTPAPINLGAAASITGASLTSWTGATSNDWTVAGNWSAGVPTSSKTCQIDSAATNPTIPASTTAVCKSVSIGNGTLSLTNSTSKLEIHGNYSNTGTLNQNGGQVEIIDSGATSAHSITSSSTINELRINKTGGGDVQISSTNLTITTLTLVSNPSFNLLVPSGRALTLANGLTMSSGTLTVQGGGTLKIGDGNSLTMNSGSTLSLVGSSGNLARVTAQSATTGFDVSISGTVSANYYQFDRMNTTGVVVNSGATINGTNYFQNGTFKRPLSNNSVFLNLDREIPGDTLAGMTFDLDGSGVTAGTITNIDTQSITGGSDSLTVDTHGGDVTGPTYEDTTGSSYSIIWQGAANTLLVTQENTQSGNMNAGSTYTMGRFGFQQKQAGASFSDADITSLKLTMTGTANASDIFEARLYFDSNCDSSGGVLIDSGNLTGSPASRTFSFSASEFTVPAHTTTPPLRCLYVDYVVSSGVVGSNTAGVQITAASHVGNDQSWDVDSSISFPINLGAPRTLVPATTTTWDGSTDSDWEDPTNWSAGVPTSSVDCVIPNVTTDPIISTVDASCNSLTIGSGGLLQLNSGRTLDVYGDFTNNGSFTHNGDLRFSDGGSGSNHSIATATTLGKVTFNKTSGGIVQTNSVNITINDLEFPSGSDFQFVVSNGSILTLPNGLTINDGVFNVQGGATVKVGTSQTVTVAGGRFKVSGTNDAYPQTTTNKGLVTVNGSGTWTFNSTSGTVELVGFLLDKLDANGLQIGGSTDLIRLDGGQFTRISTSYPVKVVNLTTTAAITETSPTNVGFYWDEANTLYNDSCCNPSTSDTFYLVYGSNCSNQLMAFDQWFGDFVEDPVNYTIEDKIYDDADGGSCQVTMNGGDSAVDLLSFTATGYDKKIVLNWVTGQETNHAGFNVYRSRHPNSGYSQINNELIRNWAGSASGHGSYRFDDENAQNDTAYYYMIQDVEWGGTSKLHGPVSATASAIAGEAPGVDSGTNYSNAPDSDASNNSVLDLGGGVKILAQSSNSFRLSIEPADPTYSVSEWNGQYEEPTISGYSSSLIEGAPQLLEKTVLIEVRDDYSQVQSEEIQVIEAANVSKKIVPAPTWASDGNGGLVKSYKIDSAIYSVNDDSPSTFYTVDSEVQRISGKSFVKVVIHPLLYNPVSEIVRKANRIVLDIGLDGQAWSTQPPVADVEPLPALSDGSLRVRFKKTGFYELTYEDLQDQNVEGPFDGLDVNELRLFYGDTELNLEVESTTGFFSSGDKLRFYAVFAPSVDDEEDELILAQHDLFATGEAAKRIHAIDVHPIGFAVSGESQTWLQARAEQDLEMRLEPAIGSFAERLFWGWIWGPGGGTFDMPIELPSLNPGSADKVRVKLTANGFSRQIVNPTFHVGFFVNGHAHQAASVSFQSQETTEMEVELDASLFVEGLNTIKVQLLGDLVPAGVYNLLYIDHLDVEYPALLTASGGRAELRGALPNRITSIEGFSQNAPLFYDVSHSDRVYRLQGVSASSPDGGSTWDMEFAAVWGIHGHGGYGQHILALEDDKFLSPSSLSLTVATDRRLKEPGHSADYLVVGTEEMIDAADQLIRHRESEGLKVLTVPLSQIYAEFSEGRVSSQAIQRFVDYALNSFESPRPKYLLLLGDATQDPKNATGQGVHPNTMPIPLLKGRYMDYGSDNYHGAIDSYRPQLSVGRIPTSNPDQLKSYVEKLLAYEAGERSPENSAVHQSRFFVGSNKPNDRFSEYTDQLVSSFSTYDPRFSNQVIEHTAIRENAVTEVSQHFAQGPLVMTYFGHGAENIWSGPDPLDSSKQITLFKDENAITLENDKLPIVLALNCWNSKFYDQYNTIGESMIFAPGGAVAFWGSTTTTIPPVQTAMAQSFFSELGKETYQYPHDVRIGELMLRAKLSVVEKSAAKDVIGSWTLFGDPAMKLPKNVFVPEPLEASNAGEDRESVVVSRPPPATAEVIADGAPPSQHVTAKENSSGGCGMALPPVPPPGNGGSPPPFVWILILPLALLVRQRLLAE